MNDMAAQSKVQSTTLKDQVAVVTGGGRGIGRAIALAVAAAGARVAVIARSQNEITTLRETRVIGSWAARTLEKGVDLGERAFPYAAAIGSLVDAMAHLSCSGAYDGPPDLSLQD